MSTYIIIGILVFLAIIAVFVIKKNKGEMMEPDYRVFFILGITWLPIGIATQNATFTGMGAVFLVAGLINKDKWKEEPKWSELSPEKRKMKIIIIVALTIILLLGLAAYLLARSS